MRIVEELQERGIQAKLHLLSDTKQLQAISAGEGGLALTLGDPGTAKTYTLKIIERFNEEVLLPEVRGHFSINAACTGKA